MRFTNLFIGYNEKENFRILICAFDSAEAKELSEEYRIDAGLDGSFEVSKLTTKIDDIHFDCDYVIS